MIFSSPQYIILSLLALLYVNYTGIPRITNHRSIIYAILRNGVTGLEDISFQLFPNISVDGSGVLAINCNWVSLFLYHWYVAGCLRSLQKQILGLNLKFCS